MAKKHVTILFVFFFVKKRPKGGGVFGSEGGLVKDQTFYGLFFGPLPLATNRGLGIPSPMYWQPCLCSEF